MRVWLLDPAAWPHGARLTPSSSAFPNEGGGSSCSLVEVLERCALPTRYFLSSIACAGILRRAVNRGKLLPLALARALSDRAGPMAELSEEELAALEAADGLKETVDDLFSEWLSEETAPVDQ